jgi:hypothetical protein
MAEEVAEYPSSHIELVFTDEETYLIVEKYANVEAKTKPSSGLLLGQCPCRVAYPMLDVLLVWSMAEASILQFPSAQHTEHSQRNNMSML